MYVTELSQPDFNGSPHPGYNSSQRIPHASQFTIDCLVLQRWLVPRPSNSNTYHHRFQLERCARLGFFVPVPPSSLCSFLSLFRLDHILHTRSPFRACRALGRRHRLIPGIPTSFLSLSAAAATFYLHLGRQWPLFLLIPTCPDLARQPRGRSPSVSPS